MKSSPIRRAQLIAPFGVGAMFTAPDGTGMITAGLDGWFDLAAQPDLELEEFSISEWRIEQQLKVADLRLPPDFRRRRRGQAADKNLELQIPALLFPLWHFCPAPSCRALVQVSPHHGRRKRCPVCARQLAGDGPQTGKRRKAPFLSQVPFIALCASGHLEDFPWREWVHRDVNPTCDRQMRLRATGGATLAAQTVHCDCGVAPRSLSKITEAFERDGLPDTHLTSQLAQGERFVCRGRRPWVDDRVGEGCGHPVKGSLRASTATYFAHVLSAIYLPGGASGLPDGLLEVFERTSIRHAVATLRQLGQAVTTDVLRTIDTEGAFLPFSDAEIQRALDELAESKNAAAAEDADLDDGAIRRPEFAILRDAKESEDLVIRPQTVDLYSNELGRFFSRVNLLERLRETRVLYGFSRIEPNQSRPLPAMKAQLWEREPAFAQSWLPAYVVRGEGIYIEVDEKALATWEAQPEVQSRARHLIGHPERVRVSTELSDERAVPRFVLLHTLSHLLINQLVFECGYSSAALRERLFCSHGRAPMAGILIYTAAGDSDGTMGGLVRMGKAGRLEGALGAALERARWCSADPVCMELGERGQGPKSMNLAACHSCGLLPETACEAFNAFLDRALVVGSHENPRLGFFDNF